MNLNEAELATTLVALRLLQSYLTKYSGKEIENFFPEHFYNTECLSVEEINKLAEKLNTENS